MTNTQTTAAALQVYLITTATTLTRDDLFAAMRDHRAIPVVLRLQGSQAAPIASRLEIRVLKDLDEQGNEVAFEGYLRHGARVSVEGSVNVQHQIADLIIQQTFRCSKCYTHKETSGIHRFCQKCGGKMEPLNLPPIQLR
jgi:hypothetical protein